MPSTPPLLLRVGSIALLFAAHLALIGCASPPPQKDITTVAGSQKAMGAQATPSEIQAAVMAFADKYSSRAADVFDYVHDQSQSSEVRLFARQAKINLGLGALTIACEVNPVAALLDMVALTRLQRRSFADHWAVTLPQEQAEAIDEMYMQSEHEAWLLANRFLTLQQSEQLRTLIDDWYDRNPRTRYTSHVRLIDFAGFRRESTPYDPDTPGNVLALLRIDPMARVDPLARGIEEARLIAERALFFSARVSPLVTWQMQRITADLMAVPEVQSMLATTEKAAATLDRMPQDVEGIVTRTSENFQKVFAAERNAAIAQADAKVTAQREAIARDLDAREVQLRGLLGEVNVTLASAKDAASNVSESANRTVKAAQEGSTEVIDRAFHRAVLLLLLVLIGVPAAIICYRYAASRLFDVPPPLGRPRA